MKLFSKINVSRIVFSHIGTLKNFSTGKLDLGDLTIFYIFPIVAASILIYYCVSFSDRSTNIIITTLSILVGLMFNVIVIIFDIIKRDRESRIKNKFLEELLTNISYSILVAITIIVCTLFTFINIYLIEQIFTWIVFFLLGNFFLTVLMILKRMYQLFDNELKKVSNQTKS